ncbi:hypothetical protein [Mucilaginibacter defluvii]|uniref:Uncharacterized protein n=1 Tax=Mucilaginibacter defluvii TaxID=1196019 RepID=A0ABP9FU29_9SPHI
MVTKLSTSNDTLNGVKIQFSKSTSYKNMVDAIDICNRTEKDHLSYVIKNDELFAYINNNNSKQVYDSLRVKPLLFDCVGSDHVFVKSDTQSSSIQSILNVPDDLSGYGIKMPLVFALCALWICIFLNMFVQALRQIMHFS